MKTVYFVRHGQSAGNAEPIFQTDDSPLTELGREQARFVAERCSHLPIEFMVASPQPRAQETASIISQKIGIPFDSSVLFRERKKPTVIEGKSFDDPEAREINKRWWNSLTGDENAAKVLDGENFEDISNRAGDALEYLAARPEEHILVVTHGFFLRYLLGRSVYGSKLSVHQFEPLMKSFFMQNTGLTVFRHGKALKPDEVASETGWTVWTWNDHAHLG